MTHIRLVFLLKITTQLKAELSNIWPLRGGGTIGNLTVLLWTWYGALTFLHAVVTILLKWKDRLEFCDGLQFSGTRNAWRWRSAGACHEGKSGFFRLEKHMLTSAVMYSHCCISLRVWTSDFLKITKSSGINYYFLGKGEWKIRNGKIVVKEDENIHSTKRKEMKVNRIKSQF